jgi:nucleoside-diphosphate-sugar epimerase
MPSSNTNTNTNDERKKVVVFGATGVIGTSLVEVISTEHATWEILAVTRSIKGTSRLASMKLPNVTMVEGDPFDTENVLKLTADCDIVYSCIGFHRYERNYWAKYWPIVTENLLAAIAQEDSDSTDDKIHKKKLVFCDNIYAYGPGENISPTTSTVEPSNQSKPAIRATVRQMLAKHMDQYPGTVTAVGGADFFGPHATKTSFLGDTMTKTIAKGEGGLAIGSINVLHDFCFAPDFSKSLAVVSENDAKFSKAADKFWICPHSIKNKTLQEIANDIAAKAAASAVENGTSSIRNKPTARVTTKPVPISVLNKWLLYLLCPFMGFAWEMIEMMPFWTNNYTVDDSDFSSTFGMEATPYDQALQSLVDFYQQEQEQTS